MSRGESVGAPVPVVVAVLETMYGWRHPVKSEAPQHRRAPRYFTINPANKSGGRLYQLVGASHKLLVTNACPELVQRADQHGTPDPVWLRENLELLQKEHSPRLILLCGAIAQKTYASCAYIPEVLTSVLNIPHPAARFLWTPLRVQQESERIRGVLGGSICPVCSCLKGGWFCANSHPPQVLS